MTGQGDKVIYAPEKFDEKKYKAFISSKFFDDEKCLQKNKKNTWFFLWIVSLFKKRCDETFWMKGGTNGQQTDVH